MEEEKPTPVRANLAAISPQFWLDQRCDLKFTCCKALKGGNDMISTDRVRAATLLAASAAAAISAGLAAQPVTVRAEPVTETIHGITLTDEYRWMEDPANAAEMLAFIEAENTLTRAMLDALPERAWFAKRLGEISSSLERIGGYQQCGDMALFTRTGAGDRLPKLHIRDAKGERPFLDPAVLTGDPLAAFGTYQLSPDCRRVSVHVSSGGSEAGKVLLIDIASGQPIGPAIERIWGEFPVSFIGDDKVLYTQMAVPADGVDPILGMTAYIAPVTGGSAVQVMGNGMLIPPEVFPLVIAPAGEPFVIGAGVGARADNEFWVAPTASFHAGAPQWCKVAGLEDKVTFAFARGNHLFVQTTRTNPAGTLLRYPLAEDGTPGAAETVFEGSPERLLRGSESTGDGIYIGASRRAAMVPTRRTRTRTGSGPPVRRLNLRAQRRCRSQGGKPDDGWLDARHDGAASQGWHRHCHRHCRRGVGGGKRHGRDPRRGHQQGWHPRADGGAAAQGRKRAHADHRRRLWRLCHRQCRAGLCPRADGLAR